MTIRRITPHKGGRTARIPSGWILPETLRRIHEVKREQGKSFADLIEEKFAGGNMDKYDMEQLEIAAKNATTLEQLQGIHDAIEAVYGENLAEIICSKYGLPLYLNRLDETQGILE